MKRKSTYELEGTAWIGSSNNNGRFLLNMQPTGYCRLCLPFSNTTKKKHIIAVNNPTAPQTCDNERHYTCT